MTPPAVTTGTASDIGATSVTLNGTVNPNGTTVFDCHFEYGTTAAYGTSLQCPAGQTGSSAVAVSGTAFGLQPQTTYHFRLDASNGPTANGSDQTFTTTAAGPAAPAPAGGALLAFGQNEFGELGNAINNNTRNPNPVPTLVTLPSENGPVARIATNLAHSLVVTSSGQLYSFGFNGAGELGVATNSGTGNPTPTPMLVSLPGQNGPVTQVAAGNGFSLAVTASGQLYAFGTNSSGELGTAANNSPNPTPALVSLPGENGPVTQVAAGDLFSLVVTSSGQLYAFGDNSYGELGSATNNGTTTPNPTPTLVSLPGENGPVTGIAAGFDQSLAVTSSGQLYAFGGNGYGELGTTANANPNPTPALVTLPGQNGVVSEVAASEYESLAATASGQLYAFGNNGSGQLGNATNAGTNNPNPTPALVSLPGESGHLTQIASGYEASLAVTSSGQLYTFGYNAEGQLGSTVNSGTGNANSTPTLVVLPAGTTIDAVAAGSSSFQSLAIVSGLAIASGSLPAGQVGSPYAASLSAVGGTAPLTWMAGGLAPGLSIDPLTGTVSGVPAAAGSFPVAATVTDSYGSQASRALSLAVAPAAPLTGSGATPSSGRLPVIPTPRVSGPRESNSVWREGSHLASFAKRSKHPVGTTFSFTLNEPAVVSFAFTQRVAGRKVNGRCVAMTKKNRRRPSCKRSATVASLTFRGHAGVNKVAFQGRVSASKRLRPGRYTLLIVASAAGKASPPATLAFTITKL